MRWTTELIQQLQAQFFYLFKAPRNFLIHSSKNEYFSHFTLIPFLPFSVAWNIFSPLTLFPKISALSLLHQFSLSSHRSLIHFQEFHTEKLTRKKSVHTIFLPFLLYASLLFISIQPIDNFFFLSHSRLSFSCAFFFRCRFTFSVEFTILSLLCTVCHLKFLALSLLSSIFLFFLILNEMNFSLFTLSLSSSDEKQQKESLLNHNWNKSLTISPFNVYSIAFVPAHASEFVLIFLGEKCPFP